jgi:6-phosphogluconolactonase
MTKLERASVQVVDTADLARVGATWMSERIGEAIATRGTARIALSGGNTPKPIYQELGALPIDWDRVHIFFADERCVPPDDPESNFRMAREVLLDRIGAAHVHRMMGEREDREAAAADYAKELPDALDLIVLGMGEDGHTASLFPGHDWSRPTGRKVIAVTGSPKPPPLRLSVTPDVIWAARARLVVVTGAGKARVVRDALQGEAPSLYPVQTARDATWLLDRAAASLLSK